VLTIHIRYITGRVVAARTDDREEPEWPPHPARVFMALAAAHFESGGNPAERAALEWLEAMPPPQIHAGDHFPRHAVIQYVPVNDEAIGKNPGPLQSAPGWSRNRQPRTFASAGLEDEIAALYWPDADAGKHLLALQSLCARVTRVGHAISLTHVWASECAPDAAPSHLPDADNPETMLRVAGGGLLDYLDRRYENENTVRWSALAVAEQTGERAARSLAKKALKAEFPDGEPVRLRPAVVLAHGYSAPSTLARPAATPGTVWSPAPLTLALERRSGPVRHLDIAATLQLTARVRDALLQHLGAGAPEALTGHKDDGPADQPHLAIFPLPFLGNEHADGHLVGIALALPRSLPPAHRRSLESALRALREQGLKLGPLGVWDLRPADSGLPKQALLPAAWTAAPTGATQWATATPYVCDRHAKSKDKPTYYAELAEEIAHACRRVLAQPGANIKIEVTSVSAHIGAPPSHAFPRLERKDGSKRRQTHAILTFDRPIVGPLLIGAGRFRGYGLCRPLPSESDQ
jgi:CRISPR-associated protein Csb2